ncbi:hypothetical protein Bbelb_067790 [Branchiostoma belcheri]|nr:hypothetical protein Bbelb_067790 [Branchiostoma belcheri]
MRGIARPHFPHSPPGFPPRDASDFWPDRAASRSLVEARPGWKYSQHCADTREPTMVWLPAKSPSPAYLNYRYVGVEPEGFVRPAKLPRASQTPPGLDSPVAVVYTSGRRALAARKTSSGFQATEDVTQARQGPVYRCGSGTTGGMFSTCSRLTSPTDPRLSPHAVRILRGSRSVQTE